MDHENTAVPRVIIVLGMHRSGTSCLAGSLQQAGLYLGDVNVSNPANVKGNRENRAIMDLHNAVLSANGGSWDAPPPSVTWQAVHKAERDALIASYPADDTWGFKDPRTLLLLEGWLERLPHARFAATYRHPLSVYESMHKRDKCPQTKAFDLWVHYNRRLLEYHERFGFDLVCFDWPVERYRRALTNMARRLNLAEPEAGFSFFEATLRENESPRREALPEPVAEIYSALEEIAA